MLLPSDLMFMGYNLGKVSPLTMISLRTSNLTMISLGGSLYICGTLFCISLFKFCFGYLCGIVKQSGLPLACLSGLVHHVEKYEVMLNAVAENEVEYCHVLSKKIKEVFSQLKTAESKHCLSNSTASGKVLSAQGIEMGAGKSANVDWKEQVCQKVQKMKSAYGPKVYTSYQQMNRARQKSGPSHSSISPVKILETKPSPQTGRQNYHTWKDVCQQNKICLREPQVAKQHSHSPQDLNQLCIMKGPENAVQKHTQGARKATEAFGVGVSVNSPGISASPLTENCNNLTEISHKPTLTFDEPSTETKHLLNVLTCISPEALNASVSEIREVVHLNDVMPTPEFLNRPLKMLQQQKQPGLITQTGKNLASDIEPSSQARYVTCHDFVPTLSKRSHSMNTMAAFDTYRISASSCHSFKQLADAEKHDWTSEKSCLLEEIKEINNRLIDSEIVLVENDSSFHKEPGGATEDSDGLIIEFLFNAVTVNQNLISHLSNDRKSIIKPLRLLVPTNYPFSSPVIVDKNLSEVSEGQKDLSTIAKSKLRVSLRCLNQTWSLGDIAMFWEGCARETIFEQAKAFGGGTFSSIYGGNIENREKGRKNKEKHTNTETPIIFRGSVVWFIGKYSNQ
ncbi:unnamed protein product [Sphenostylis stenocarpa]|uniref:ARC105/Med15 mediator subunit C-terminal domain-containing protein n=1 Tax=Sphenostylis stenocarpa TaxID=92480 RepID=A0AA86W3N8_9FABA|nr:unnamed protein product [Sphenostylis stenocarpa]